MDIAGNVALIDITSLNPMATSMVVQHFGAEDKMRIRVTAPPSWRGEFYTLTIIAETTEGDPAPGLDCVLLTEDLGAWDAGYSTPSNYEGRCIEMVGSTALEIQLLMPSASGPTVVGRRLFDMPMHDKTVRITVELP